MRKYLLSLILAVFSVFWVGGCAADQDAKNRPVYDGTYIAKGRWLCTQR